MQHLSLIWVVVIVGIIFWKIRLFAHAFDEVSNANFWICVKTEI